MIVYRRECGKLARLVFVILALFISARAQAAPAISALHAYYLYAVPSDYNKLETLFRSLKKTGADTVIVRPLFSHGQVDKHKLTDAVYLAHQDGLKLFVTVPTRNMQAVLSEHPDWEDMHYDGKLGSLAHGGKLDLFNPAVIVYLTDLYRAISANAVDGIVLDEDFVYRETEGLSSYATSLYLRKFGSALNPSAALAQAYTKGGELTRTDDFGETFWNWAEMKKDRLILLLQNIVRSSRAVNPKILFGIPVPSAGAPQVKERLARYSHDMKAFQKMSVDFYWVVIPHRDLRERDHLSYGKTLETVSRMAKSAALQMQDTSRLVFAIQTTSTSGNILPTSEIEDIVEMVGHAGKTGIAFMINAESQVPEVLARKIFTR